MEDTTLHVIKLGVKYKVTCHYQEFRTVQVVKIRTSPVPERYTEDEVHSLMVPIDIYFKLLIDREDGFRVWIFSDKDIDQFTTVNDIFNNCGMFIDVFCLDEIPDGHRARRRFARRLNEIAKMQRFCFGKPLRGGLVVSVKHAVQRLVYSLFYNSPDAAQLFCIYHESAGMYAGKGCKQIAHLDFGFKQKFVWNKSDWDAMTMLDFEDVQLAAPQGYNAILTTQYGDYMQLPDDKSTHDYFAFDPDVAYQEFFG